MSNPPPCQWRDGEVCPFADDPQEVVTLEGRSYCLCHWPLAQHNRDSKERLRNYLAKRASEREPTSTFDGALFPTGHYQFRRESRYSFRFCTFEDDCELDFRTDHTKAHINIVEALALGELRVNSIRAEKFDFSQSQFHGKLAVSNRAEHVPLRDLNFAGSHFAQTFSLAYDNKPSRLSLDRCTFHRAPDFSRIEVLPDRTFFRATFDPSAISAEDEGRYQRIRNLFHTKRSREEEGKFYALEKRCQRTTYSYPPLRNIFARFFSWSYDVFSEYGQSYERAFGVLVSLQVVAAILYGLALNGFCWSCCDIDGQVVRFTMAQAFKPFEAFAARGVSEWTTDLIGVNASGWWLVWTTLHSLLTIVLLALFLLALRWRFRRD